ncbi:hypothetical protein LTR91_010077 [Friedmanniomyces endolithicus]|uniref:Chromosome segregation ATPase family protein n=1 Tax=Friedmanniomyces endolithicus TaxID=329885 RepID=A0AAN6KKY2_9PEZI|nr:hypothetical protein LTR57_015110 [Friedmanniomyces endolithicus]KAK0972009.1 hypothetical protein LTS01_015114 [Friedmanniomyces endolithicus]KAK0987027.1 hypothetical protein LTR91_010077 [Friedmanniomyces endolithicus]KAK1034927.1 hypothetical protein LTS16_015007 [Friedmanniomyces endolithicus]
MAGAEREASRDSDMAARHQHSFSESGRSSVPMWDSSDPERAPPPLPIPPGANSPTTKANTSAGIAAAAKQIVERARESAPLSSYTSNQTPQGSPERSLVKGAHHKRLQSLQTGSVKDLRSYLDGSRSPEKSPERPTSRGGSYFSRQESKEDISLPADRSVTPTPAPKDPMKETPTLRPTTRNPPRGILSENTPPSSTMLALQNMHVPDDALHDITNAPSTPSPIRANTHYDFSSQLLHLTSIATNLQKEMSGLSRRSKDNATDLISLKEATNQRDEDIRKSLRELANVMGSTQHLLGPPQAPGPLNRTASSYSFWDNKAFNSPPSASKSWSVPRAASAHSFLEDGRVGSPSPYSVEGAASVAMLEKIIREMVTKEGQERLLSTLSELLEKSHKDNSEAAKRVKELSEFIKDKSASQALVSMPKDGPPKLELNFDSPARLAKITREGATEDKTAVDEEIMNMLKRIKESVAHSGGSTNEVKGLVRDLRGEVLGMGRELGRKLDQVSETQLKNTLERSIGAGQGQEHAEEVQRIVEEGMAELKDHLAGLMKRRAEQDDDTFRQLSTVRSGPSGEEMFAVVKHALAEHGTHLAKREPHEAEPSQGLDKDGVLDAVKEGLKDFEPNIELQQFGLERDEILAVLKEGLAEYQNERPEPASAQIDKGEIFEVMQEALKDFTPPFPAEAMEAMKSDILENVRQALAEHQPALSAPSMDDEAVHAAVTEAVKEGLANHGPAAPREIEISRDDLFDAVKASLDGSAIPFGGFGEQLLQRMHELIDNMRTEFQQYSAANGRDTEQVLDAVKDGLESLRAEIETYVDRAQDVTGKDEILDTVKGGLEQLRGDVQGYCLEGATNTGGKSDMLEYIRKEFEHLHETIGSRDMGDDGYESKSNQHAEVLRAVNEGMESLKTHINEKDRDLEIDFPTDEIHETMKEEFEQLKTSLLNANAADKGELIETIQESMGALHSKLGDSSTSALSGGGSEELINELHQEFDELKEALQIIVTQSERDAVIDGVKQSIEDLRTQLSADNSEFSAETLAAMREELDKFKETMASSIVLGGAAGAGAATIDHTEALEDIRGSLTELRDTAAARSTPEGAVPTELLEAMRGEFENLRTSIATSIVHGGSNEEVLDAIRLGLDDLGSHVERKLESPDRNQAQQSEMLDAINEGLETLRADVVKTLDKPLDMTVNYEILDTLKDGLTGLRAEIDILKSEMSERPETPKGGQIVLAEPIVGAGISREISEDMANEPPAPPASEMFQRADLQKMEVLLAQLQIKVEAMDATIQEFPISQPVPVAAEGTAMKHDLALIEAMIKDMQDNIIVLAAREVNASAPEGAARKDDTDAIETLLRNTKAQIEELAMPDPATAVTKEHLDAVEAVVRLSNEAIESLADKVENSAASKADIAVVEVLAQDIKIALEELKESVHASHSDDDKPELMTKTDLDIIGLLCTEIKERVNEVALANPEDLPTKSDIEQLQGLIHDFRESHDKLKDSYETDIAVTAKAFDDRKQEFESTVEQIVSIKDVLSELKDDILLKMSDGESGINTLGETLKGLEEKTSGNEPVLAEVKEVMEALVREFERAHGSLESMKVDHQQSAETSLEKQAEHKDAMVVELGEKLDSLFDGMMSKYDDAQRAAEEKATAQAELLEDAEAHGGVDDTYNKLDETQEGLKYEHTITREEVGKALVAIAGVQGDLMEHNPRFLMTLKEVQALIGQHYEHSQRASEGIEQQHQAVRDLSEQLRAGFEDTKTRHASQTEELRTALPALLPAPSAPADIPVPVEKYDDSALHDKLDKLVGHAEDAANPSAQLERLDQIHERVMATAADVSAFVAAQAKQITQDHEDKEREAEELALLLERRAVQKDEIEADIEALGEEKDSLRRAVEALKAEKEALAAQKSRMNADVSSLETALRIRRDELHEMDAKAEMIERRMLEGVMNQSRMLLLAKGTKSAPLKKQQGRDLRVPSSTSVASAQTVTSTVPGLKANHSLAMKTRPSMLRNGAMPNSTERRIMSLNQINHNVPTGAHALSTTPSLVSNSSQRLQRSHSVKTPQFPRKGSWAGKRNLSMNTHNKENERLSEESEDELSRPESRDFAHEEDDFGSDTATERRTSYASGTESGLTYGEGSSADGVTPGEDHGRNVSYGTSDLSYGTGSYMTGSEVDGRDSLASSLNGVVGAHSGVGEEHGGENGRGGVAHEEPLRIEGAPAHVEHAETKSHFGDSGLGTDLPTAAWTDSEYFKRDAE